MIKAKPRVALRGGSRVSWGGRRAVRGQAACRTVQAGMRLSRIRRIRLHLTLLRRESHGDYDDGSVGCFSFFFFSSGVLDFCMIGERFRGEGKVGKERTGAKGKDVDEHRHLAYRTDIFSRDLLLFFRSERIHIGRKGIRVPATAGFDRLVSTNRERVYIHGLVGGVDRRVFKHNFFPHITSQHLQSSI